MADHPVLAGIDDEHLRNWRGEATITPPRLDYKLSPEFNYTPTVRWCGIPVSRLWRCGNRGNVASVLIEKPARGDFLPILDGGYSLQYSPLMEYREGKGMVLFCQMDLTARTESDPAAETLARNLLDYVSTWKPSTRRKAIYVGDPADVHNPAPRAVPLVSAAAAIGNGVLGKAPGANVVFCQLPPSDTGPEQRNLKRTYRRTSFLLNRLLGNMGVAGSTPLLDRFSTTVGGSRGTSVVKNGDFSADVNDDGMPDEWMLSSDLKESTCRCERIRQDDDAVALVLTCPPVEGEKRSSTMLAQHDVPVKKGQWYRISFEARPERLVSESVTMTITNTATWRSFFEYQRFAPEPEWKRFRFEVQSNETADERTRLQIWYEGAGKLWLADVRVEPIANSTEGRWLEGLYLDVPEQWDDPYRFFRW